MIPLRDVAQQTKEETSQRVARLLRHEVGDLLQSVYSTVAILMERLPGERAQERRILADLKSRAELCRFELDAVVELVSPLQQRHGAHDLDRLLSVAVAHCKRRYPGLTVPLDSIGSLLVTVDGQALAGAVTFLLQALCQAARKQVEVKLNREEDVAVCQLERDGISVCQEELTWLTTPFATTHQALFGLALALTRRTIEPCGGSLTVTSPGVSGLCVRITIPVLDI